MWRYVATILSVAALVWSWASSALAQTRSEELSDRQNTAPAEHKKLAWRNSSFVFDQYLSKNTLFKDAQLSYNPTYIQSYSLRPRWHFTDSLSLRFQQDLIFEPTEPDEYGSYSAYSVRERLFLIDTLVQITDTNLYEINGIQFGAAGQLVLPISPASQASRRILGAGVKTTVVKSFKKVLQGLELSADGLYRHYFALSNVPAASGYIQCAPALSNPDEAPIASLFCLGGPSSISDVLAAGLGAELGMIAELRLSLGFGWVWYLGRGFSDARIDTLTGEAVVPDSSQTHWRNVTEFSLSLSYLFSDWFQLAAGLYTGSAQLEPDGSRTNPFFNIDTQSTMTATVLLDRLYLRLGG